MLLQRPQGTWKVRMALSAPDANPHTPGAVRLVILLAVVFFISYVDRGTLATAAPLIKDQLHLNSTRLGLLLSAFFWSYTLAVAPAGWLAERYGAKPVLTGGVALWSISTLLTGLSGGLYSLFVCRLLLGIGESAAFPCVGKLLATQIGSNARGRANGVTVLGQALGPAGGTWIGGMVAAKWGWRPMFVCFGALSLLWILPWRRTTLSAPLATNQRATEPPVPLTMLIRERSLWGTSIGLFCANYALYFFSSWLPTYLVKVHGLSMNQMAQTAGAIFVVWALSAFAVGVLFDWLLRSGANRTTVSKALLVIGCVGKVTCITGIVLWPAALAIPLLYFNELFSGFFSPIIWSMSQTIAGPRAIGRWMGLQLMFGNVAGIIAPVVTGLAIDFTGSFAVAFWLVAAFLGIAAFAWLFLVQQVEPLQWNLEPARTGIVKRTVAH
jgi:MFS family permease